jgi:ADP-ribose pyrophosphatase
MVLTMMGEDKMSSFYEKTIETKSVFRGRLINVEVTQVELPNGQTSFREVVKHPGAVAIIPFTRDGRLVLIRQFRKPLEKEIYEIPAGKLEKGEDPLMTAQRELMEETGYQSDDFHFVTSFYTSPGFANELLYIYEATELMPGPARTDEDEFVETHLITLEEGLNLLANQKIHDAKTAFAILYWQNKELKQRLESKR